MDRFLITGGTGFLGQALVRRLLAIGETERICIYSRDEHKQAAMRDELGADGRLRFFIGDVRDRERLRRATRGCDILVHAAALKRIETGYYNPDEMIKTNVGGALNVIEAALENCRKAMLISTDKAFRPVSPYGCSKAMAESLFLNANHMTPAGGCRFAVVRYGNVAGATGSVIPKWRQAMGSGRRVEMTDGEATRFWMTATEAVDFVLASLRLMPEAVRVPELPAYRLRDLAEAMGVSDVISTGLPAWEKLHECMAEDNCSHTARRMSVDELKLRLVSL